MGAKGEKVTIYVAGEMMGNVTKIEATLLEHGARRYAQYESAPYAVFIPKGKRKPRQIQKTSRPYLLIVKGHGHPDPDSLFLPATYNVETRIGVSAGRYRSCDPRWETDFDALIDATQVEILADYRHTKGFNPYAKKEA